MRWLAASCLIVTACGWKTIAPKDGGFSVMMPPSATEKVQSIEGTPPVTVHVWLTKLDDVSYLLSYYDIPPAARSETQENALRDEAHGFLKGCHGVLDQERLVEGARHPTLRVTGACGGGQIALGVITLRGARIYQLFVVAGKGSAPDEATLNRFFDSFKVTD